MNIIYYIKWIKYRDTPRNRLYDNIPTDILRNECELVEDRLKENNEHTNTT